MHTFEIKCSISSSMFQYLLNLPCLVKVSNRVYRTNYYLKKGITQIEIRVYRYTSKITGDTVENYYLLLRCNAGMIMGEDPVLALDMNNYTKDEIIERLQKRIYEINELRFLNIHKCDMVCWKADRVDIAKDIMCIDINPTLEILMCNLSFPYNHYNMKPIKIKKDKYQFMTESCYFRNKSRTINFYIKLAERNNNNKIIDDDTLDKIENMIRIEIQINRKGIYNLNRNKQDKRSLENFLDNNFCYSYLEKEILSIFGAEKYVNMSTAKKLIDQSTYSTYDKNVLLSIIQMIHKYNGLYELEKAIADVNTFTPTEYGNLRKFRNKWLQKIRLLGINPVTIPDRFGTTELPSLYELLNKKTN